MLQVARERRGRSSEDIPFASPWGMTCGQSVVQPSTGHEYPGWEEEPGGEASPLHQAAPK